MKILRSLLIGVIAVVALLYVAFLAGLYFLQRDFQYVPTGEITALEAARLANTQLVSIPTGDDASLAGWYAPPAAGMPTILYYKGNSGSFSAEHERFAQWTAEGYGFLAFDYRGFPMTPGAITEDNILTDSMAAFDWLATRTDRPILIWGRSLGTGPATFVASQRDAGALLLETPFLSAVSVAAERYPFAPVAWLMFDQFHTNEWIRDVEELTFIAHGTADQTIAVSNSERLQALVPNPYPIWIEPGADHGDLWARGIWPRAKAFFAEAQEDND